MADDKSFMAACVVAKMLRSEKLMKYDSIACALSEAGYRTKTGLICWNVGMVFRIIRGDFDGDVDGAIPPLGRAKPKPAR